MEVRDPRYAQQAAQQSTAMVVRGAQQAAQKSTAGVLRGAQQAAGGTALQQSEQQAPAAGTTEGQSTPDIFAIQAAYMKEKDAQIERYHALVTSLAGRGGRRRMRIRELASDEEESDSSA